jgi:hypothetical protein
MHLDIRNIPRLFRDEHHRNISRGIILAELEKELQVQRENLLLSDVRPDGELAEALSPAWNVVV